MFRHFVVPPNGSVVQGILPKIMTPQSRLKNFPKVQLFFWSLCFGGCWYSKKHTWNHIKGENKPWMADGVSKVGAFGTKPFWVPWLVQFHDVWSPSPVMRLPPGKDPWIIMNYHDSSTCSICTGGIRDVEVPVGKFRSFLPWGFVLVSFYLNLGIYFESVLSWFRLIEICRKSRDAIYIVTSSDVTL